MLPVQDGMIDHPSSSQVTINLHRVIVAVQHNQSVVFVLGVHTIFVLVKLIRNNYRILS